MEFENNDYIVATISLGLVYRELVGDADEITFAITLDELEDLAKKFFVEITSDSADENTIVVNIRKIKQEE